MKFPHFSTFTEKVLQPQIVSSAKVRNDPIKSFLFVFQLTQLCIYICIVRFFKTQCNVLFPITCLFLKTQYKVMYVFALLI